MPICLVPSYSLKNIPDDRLSGRANNGGDTRAGVAKARQREGSLIRYCGSYGTPVLPEHPGWIIMLNSEWKEGGDVCFRLCFGGAIGGIQQIAERTVEDRERNLSIVCTDRHITGSNDDDTTAYVSYHLTRFVCSLIACREYDARCQDQPIHDPFNH
ncbi:hypothetical protein ALC57_10758 [Trachymyrmex cornetzi]|uniref:Uncharacterized protein n=1 Tax=Trachymyrmex cornetzi TaxID=471704 RepID=A0A151J3F1_9HYME|nr:hypothetical protein ALC57_10758 [Trachymyrmex cornetzi]